MIAGIQSVLTGLQIFAIEIEDNVCNVAKLNTNGLKKDRVVLSALVPQGVKATLEQADAPGTCVTGRTNRVMEMMEQPNVDLAEELPSMMSTVHGYKASLKASQAAADMIQSVLSTLEGLNIKDLAKGTRSICGNRNCQKGLSFRGCCSLSEVSPRCA